MRSIAGFNVVRRLPRRFGRTSAVVLALALLAVGAAPVSATKPDRAFAPSPEHLVVTGFCTFDVAVDVVVNNEYATTFFDRNGNVTRTHIAGRLVVRLTNVDNGPSMVLQVSGPGTFIADENGLTVETRGRWFLFFAGRFILVSGNTELRVDAAGESIVSISGRTVDLCEALSA